MQPLLTIQDLSAGYGGKTVIRDISLTLMPGEILGVVGESGSGKSVSSLGVMRLIPNPPGQITGGSILYKGRDLVQASEKEMQKIRGNEISMIFQEPMTSLNPIIKCGDVERLKTAPGAPRHANPFWINFGAREEIVGRTNAIPDDITGKG